MPMNFGVWDAAKAAKNKIRNTIAADFRIMVPLLANQSSGEMVSPNFFNINQISHAAK
jgi:hypothetical protein